MAIYKGNKEIVGLYKGPTEIIKRYKGSNLIYESLLPYSFEYLYNSLIPTAINNKTVKDKAQVKTIYGNSVVENQQFKINSTDQTRTLNGITMTDNRDGSYTFNGTATSETILAVGGSIPTINIGDKYLVFGGAKGGSSTTYFLTQNSSGANDYGNGAVYTQPDNQYGRFLCVVIRNGVTVNNLVVKPQHISLTQWYPFNTPTTLTDTRVQSIINRGNIPYNTGTLKSVNIGEFVSEPYNLFDGIFERGDIDSSTGEETTDNRFIRNYNFIKVIAGQTYSLEQFDFTFLTSAQRKIVQFDENKNIIRATTNYNDAGQFANPYTITLESNCRYVRIVYYNAATQIPLDLKCAFHRTDTRTGYAPHTQSHTLPFIYQGNSALNAHDTLEIADTEYVFTKNVNNIIYNGNANENWQEYGSGSQRFTILNNLWSSPSSSTVANILCNKLQTYPKNEIFNKEYAISGSDDNVNYFVVRINSSITDITALKTWLSNNPINVNYELATPQVTRIPKKHLAVVDLGSLNWTSSSSYGAYSSSLNQLAKKPTNNNTIPNIYCSKYTSSYRSQYGLNNRMLITIDQTGDLDIEQSDLIGLTNKQIQSLLGGTYLFYETQDEVADIISDIDIEAGGTLTSNLFSWVENQLAVLTRESATLRDITFTKNGDNNVSVSGTSQQDENFVIGTFNNISGHKYLARTIFLSGKPTDSSGYWIKWKTVNYGKDIGDGIIFTGTATEDSYIIFTIDSGNVTIDCRFRLQVIDLTIGFGEGKEPTSINDPHIQHILKQGYIPTNTVGTIKSIASEVLPNIDASFNRK